MEVDDALLLSDTARAAWESEAVSVQHCAAWLRSGLHSDLLPGGGGSTAINASQTLRRPLAARAVGILLASDETISELNGAYRVSPALLCSLSRDTERGTHTHTHARATPPSSPVSLHTHREAEGETGAFVLCSAGVKCLKGRSVAQNIPTPTDILSFGLLDAEPNVGAAGPNLEPLVVDHELSEHDLGDLGARVSPSIPPSDRKSVV